jgi:ABC-type oligopeptide transport system substrate-binding subunit
MRLKTFAAIAAAAVLLIAACGGPASDSPDAAKPLVLRRGLGGQPGSLDPHRAEDAFSYDVLRDLYEGLTASSPSGEVIPAAAETWRTADGGKTYIFTIRGDARWSNGDPVTATHFVTALRRALDPATASGAADLLRTIVNAPAILDGSLPPDQLGVRALDERRLEISLSRPVPFFPDILTNTVASPIHPSSLAATADLDPLHRVVAPPFDGTGTDMPAITSLPKHPEELHRQLRKSNGSAGERCIATQRRYHRTRTFHPRTPP